MFRSRGTQKRQKQGVFAVWLPPAGASHAGRERKTAAEQNEQRVQQRNVGMFLLPEQHWNDCTLKRDFIIILFLTNWLFLCLNKPRRL